MKKILIALLLTTTVALSQELLPELKPLAEKYVSERLSMGGVWEKEYARILEPYARALNDLEKEATAKGNLPLIAAIQKENETLGDGSPSAFLPATLPKSLEGTRKTFMAQLTEINLKRKTKTQQIDADYLRALLSLSARSKNPELQKQIGLEKIRVLKADSQISAAPTTKNLLRFPIGGEGWEVQATSKAESMDENGVKFTRISGSKMELNMDIPAGTKNVKLSGEIRSISGMAPRGYGVFAVYTGVSDTGKAAQIFGSSSPQNIPKTWTHFNLVGNVPAGVTGLNFKIMPTAGSFDVRELALSVR